MIFPVISIRMIADTSALDASLDQLDEYAWIIFTSGYGVRFFLNRMEDRGIAVERCNRRQVCAVGPATAAELQRRGVRVSLIPGEFVAEGVLAALQRKSGRR